MIMMALVVVRIAGTAYASTHFAALVLVATSRLGSASRHSAYLGHAADLTALLVAAVVLYAVEAWTVLPVDALAEDAFVARVKGLIAFTAQSVLVGPSY